MRAAKGFISRSSSQTVVPNPLKPDQPFFCLLLTPHPHLPLQSAPFHKEGGCLEEAERL